MAAADSGSRLAEVHARIRAACQRVGRSPEEVTLVAVSKRQPLERIRSVFDQGQLVFGENQVQEASAKSAELPAEIRWHLIGPLQSNKVKRAARLFGTVHSVDRTKIALALDREAARLDRGLRAFLQVNVGGEESKHGFSPEGLGEAVSSLAGLGSLRIVGLMAIPPYEAEPEDARPWFRRLRELRDELQSRPEWSDRLPSLSMGMSHDFEVAIEEGATHIRVGTALFGPRNR